MTRFFPVPHKLSEPAHLSDHWCISFDLESEFSCMLALKHLKVIQLRVIVGKEGGEGNFFDLQVCVLRKTPLTAYLVKIFFHQKSTVGKKNSNLLGFYFNINGVDISSCLVETQKGSGNRNKRPKAPC